MAHILNVQAQDSLEKARGSIEMNPLSDVTLIRTGQGNLKARAMFFAGMAKARAVLAWFERGDLIEFKQWSFVNARAQMARTVRFGGAAEEAASPGGTVLDMLMPILCDDEATVSWFAHADERYVCELTEKPKSMHFLSYQTVLALRGDWNRVVARSKLALSDPPRSKEMQAQMIEHELFLAMANRDIATIEHIIEEITSPKGLRARNLWEGAFFKGLVSTPGTIYAKIAWRHGMEVKPKTSLVPIEWMPVAPLRHYDLTYDILEH